MSYVSTRNHKIACSFEEAICSGYAPDGGLFVPDTLPEISTETLQKWATFSYPELTEAILRIFISDKEVSDEELHSICESIFVGFECSTGDIVPVRRVGNFYVSELFHGPTFCFKDLGMRATISFLSHFSRKSKKRICLLVSTTGDTGPAAVQAVADMKNPLLNILVHYPHNQISDFQRKQLTTVNSPHVRIAAFEGGGDDMDKPIKNLLSQQRQNRASESIWTGVNSYNIARPLMQMVHFIWTFLRVSTLDNPNGELRSIDVVLPTGAMGNIAGGYMAKKMGVPFGKLCAGVNANDITHRVIDTGIFEKSPSMLKTLSEAINIQVPYNFERLLYYLTNGDDQQVAQWMKQLDETNRIVLSDEWHKILQQDFCSARVSDEEMIETIRNVQDNWQYLMDPHTAVGWRAGEKQGYYKVSNSSAGAVPNTVLLATASPCKFERAVTKAIGPDGWQAYLSSSDFPASARDILCKDEVPPVVYEARANLEESQIAWEETARAIIDEMTSV